MISYKEAKTIAEKNYGGKNALDACLQFGSRGYYFFNNAAEKELMDSERFDDVYGTGIFIGSDGVVEDFNDIYIAELAEIDEDDLHPLSFDSGD